MRSRAAVGIARRGAGVDRAGRHANSQAPQRSRETVTSSTSRRSRLLLGSATSRTPAGARSCRLTRARAPYGLGPRKTHQRLPLARHADAPGNVDHDRRPSNAIAILSVTGSDRDIGAVSFGQAEQRLRAAQVVSLELGACLLGGRERQDGSNRAGALPTTCTDDGQCRRHVGHAHRRRVNACALCRHRRLARWVLVHRCAFGLYAPWTRVRCSVRSTRRWTSR
jgi:hypothetical protein